VQMYRRAWSGATRALVVVGAVVPLLAWCVASHWTFAAALAAAYWARGLAVRAGSSGAGRRLQHRFAAVPFVDVRNWRLLRLLPALALAALGWSMLLGAAGAGLLLVDTAFGLPILARDRHDRWPDGRDVGDIPDTVEELAPAASSESAASAESSASAASSESSTALSPVSVSWPGPRTLLPDLADDELLHAWESSTRALGLRPGPEALLGIVTARARYLDALDERDPEGLAGRLAMGDRDHWNSFDSPA
jgi:hypothetical protein